MKAVFRLSEKYSMSEDDSVSGESTKRNISDTYPPSQLFEDNFWSLPAIYKLIRDLINLKEGNLQLHLSGRIMMDLDYKYYKKREYIELGIDFATRITAVGRWKIWNNIHLMCRHIIIMDPRCGHWDKFWS